MTAKAQPKLLSLWPALVGLLCTALLAVIVAPLRPSARTANLALQSSALPECFLMLHKTEAGSGYLLDRRTSTTHRDDAGNAGHKRSIDRVR